jgi:hypothetical protein
MSFSFSVGGLIGAASLTHCLIRALQGSHDAGDDYRAAIHELGCMQHAFMKVYDLGKIPNTSGATFRSAYSIVMGAMYIIQSFLEKDQEIRPKAGETGTVESGAEYEKGRVDFVQGRRHEEAERNITCKAFVT